MIKNDGMDFFPQSYEFRPQQQKIINDVIHALENDRLCLVEAPPGTGKTIAALCGSFPYSLTSGRIYWLGSYQNIYQNLTEDILAINREVNANLLLSQFIQKQNMCLLKLDKKSEFYSTCKKAREEKKCQFYENTYRRDREGEVIDLKIDAKDFVLKLDASFRKGRYRSRLRKISKTIADNFDYLEQIYAPQNLRVIYYKCCKLMEQNPGVQIHFKDAFLKKMHLEPVIKHEVKQYTLDQFFLQQSLSSVAPKKQVTTKIDKRTRKYRLLKAKEQADQIFAQLNQIKVEIQEIDIDHAISGATQYYFLKYQYSDQQFEYLTRTALVNYIRHTYTNYDDYLSILDNLVLIPFTYREILGLYTRREEVYHRIKETFNATIEAKYADAITQTFEDFEDYEQSILDRKPDFKEVISSNESRI
ncbi:MAG: hypothetical protein ACFE9L_00755 [Candidatus Hodarchaeota archaeon]